MSTGPGEVQRLRSALRDLVALSTIPASWVGREPALIATGLADALVGTLQVDFAFVRLHDPAAGAAIDVSRGSGSDGFPLWVVPHLDAEGCCTQGAVLPDVGEGPERFQALIAPLGNHGVAGWVAAGCSRPGFPSETDQLLMSVAANHAATALQNARLARERRAAEDALRATRDELEVRVAERTAELHRTGADLATILDASPIGIVLLGPDRTVLRCNPAFQRLLGWPAEELVGRRLPIPPEVEDLFLPSAEPADGPSGRSGLEVQIPRKDGSRLDASIACAPLLDENGRLAGLVANLEDIGERKRAEESLRRARLELAHVTRLTALGELAASIAHEINQPLTAIVTDASASLNWLAKPVPDLVMVREALGGILADGHRAGAVIHRIRQLATKTEAHLDSLDLNGVIQEVVALVRGEIHLHQASLRAALAPALPAVLGDRVQLQQVLINLVRNGLEAMEAIDDRQREILIRSSTDGNGRVVVAVEDAGLGFDPAVAERLFDAFFTTKPFGMGMGLSISRALIESHGGRLWGAPNPSHGATFQFALPAAR